MSGGRNIPESSMKENDGRATIAFVVEIVREEKVGMQVTAWRFPIDISGRGGKEFFVPCFTDHGRLGEILHGCFGR